MTLAFSEVRVSQALQQLLSQRLLLSMAVSVVSEMHSNTLRSLTQPCLTAYCIWCNTPVIQTFAASCWFHP